MRILEWIVHRSHVRTPAIESPIGWMPQYQDIDWEGIENFSEADFFKAMSIDRDDWGAELLQHDELFIRLFDRIPKEMLAIKELILSAMWRSPDHWEMEPDPT